MLVVSALQKYNIDNFRLAEKVKYNFVLLAFIIRVNLLIKLIKIPTNKIKGKSIIQTCTLIIYDFSIFLANNNYE